MPLEQAQVSQTCAQKKSERAAEQDRPDVAKARDEWRASQPDLKAERLVFIDETGEGLFRRYLFSSSPVFLCYMAKTFINQSMALAMRHVQMPHQTRRVAGGERQCSHRREAQY